MIVFVRSLKANSRKSLKAVQWAEEATAYINDNLNPPNPLRFLTPRFGNRSKFVWTEEFEDLGALDSFQQKIMSDEGYRQRSAKAVEDELFMGDPHDQVYVVH